MIGKKTFATSTAALILAAGFVATGCGLFGGEEEGDGDGGGNGGGTGGTAATAGVGGVIAGMSGTGPTGGGGTTAGTSGASGTSGAAGSGGAQGGAAGSGGSGGGAAAMGPYACKGDVANCGVISDFPATTAQTFGNAMFSGGVSVFGDGIMRDMANTTGLHVTGMVAGYGRGFNIWFSLCSTLQAYGGVEFIVSGTTADAMAMNTIEFQAQTNSDYPWQPFVSTNGVKGACTAPDPMNAWSVCIAPGKAPITLGTAPQQVMWADITGGMPTAWTAAMSPSELVGIQWQFPWSEGRAAYAVDVTLDDVKFIGGTGPTTACPPYSSGSGGMGGMSGAGGAGGGAAGGGAGGAGGGMGGMAGGGRAGGGAGGGGGRAGGGGGT
jgi:hypothetical protein